MARSRSSLSSGFWRYLRPLKRPERLGLAVVAFVIVSFAVWECQNLLRERDDEIYKLKEENNSLKEKLQRSGQSARSGEDTIHEDPLDNELRVKVKEAMLHAWNSYEKFAWGQDELPFNIQRLSFEVEHGVHTLEDAKKALQRIVSRGSKSREN